MASENQTSAAVPTTAVPTFELRRFVWGMPDRLEVVGMFNDLGDTPVDGAPVLVVKAGETVHRLPAVPDSLDGPPKDGRLWQAQFAWQDPPFAFGEAELQLGARLVVALPEPGAKKGLLRPRVLKVEAAPAGEADSRHETTPPVEREPEAAAARRRSPPPQNGRARFGRLAGRAAGRPGGGPRGPGLVAAIRGGARAGASRS